jgi:N-acetylglucosaminyldiphosphoundecaprenol N-acetyl-beta-D-mannosaminyltransferase
VGAAFDYEAGVQTPAPRILGALGLEWLHRLLHDPRRLFVRYLVEPWSLIGPALGDVARYRLRRGRPGA